MRSRANRPREDRDLLVFLQDLEASGLDLTQARRPSFPTSCLSACCVEAVKLAALSPASVPVKCARCAV